MSTRPRYGIRRSLTLLTALGALAVLASCPAEAKPGHSRERASQESKAGAAKPEAPSRNAPGKSAEARPVSPQPMGRPDQAGPMRPSLTPTPRPVQVAPFEQPAAREARPASPAADRGGRADGAGKPTPYRLYQTPGQPQTPDPPSRDFRPQPVARPETGRPEPGPNRVDDGRGSDGDRRAEIQPWGPARTRAPNANGQERPQGDVPRGRETNRARRAAPPSTTNADRALRAPEAGFRGPEAERNVRVVQPQEQQRFRRELQERIRNENRGGKQLNQRPARDVVGNEISSDVKIVSRDSISRVSVNYGQLRAVFGEPSYHYVIAPRSRADYWDGYWDGYTDGYQAGKHHWHGTRVVINYYYGYYWSDPYWFAFYYPGYYPSIYHYWGWCPGWVQPARVYYVPVEYVYVPSTPYRYYTPAAYVDELAAHRVLEDVRAAWFRSEVETLAYHLTDSIDIRVYFDGEYEYSTTTEDYYAMTVDAMATTHTVAMDFDTPIWLSTHEFFVTGQHVFYDPSGSRQTVYVSYRFRNLGGEWYLVAVGTSLEPIRHQYSDFRW